MEVALTLMALLGVLVLLLLMHRPSTPSEESLYEEDLVMMERMKAHRALLEEMALERGLDQVDRLSNHRLIEKILSKR